MNQQYPPKYRTYKNLHIFTMTCILNFHDSNVHNSKNKNYLETTKIFTNGRMATSVGVYQYKVIQHIQHGSTV